jgi:predicted nucleic acid-binding Zn ribbon protein
MRTRAGIKSNVWTPPRSVKELLGRRFPTLTRLTGEAAQQEEWSAWLEAHLPPEIAARLSGVHERDGVLVVFAESAAWSARLRFALQELEPALRQGHPRVTATQVRVLPRR